LRQRRCTGRAEAVAAAVFMRVGQCVFRYVNHCTRDRAARKPVHRKTAAVAETVAHRFPAAKDANSVGFRAGQGRNRSSARRTDRPEQKAVFPEHHCSGTLPTTGPFFFGSLRGPRVAVGPFKYEQRRQHCKSAAVMVSRYRSMPAVRTCMHRPSAYLSTMRPGRRSPSELTSRHESVRSLRMPARRVTESPIRAQARSRQSLAFSSEHAHAYCGIGVVKARSQSLARRRDYSAQFSAVAAPWTSRLPRKKSRDVHADGLSLPFFRWMVSIGSTGPAQWHRRLFPIPWGEEKQFSPRLPR